MNTPYRLKTVLGSSFGSDPDDVWATKQNLKIRGYYRVPEYGMTEYPDRHLFDSIRRFQRDQSLKVDGVMKPNGETERHLLDDGEDIAATFWCTVCGAPHGGVYSPRICWQCWNKGYR